MVVPCHRGKFQPLLLVTLLWGSRGSISACLSTCFFTYRLRSKPNWRHAQSQTLPRIDVCHTCQENSEVKGEIYFSSHWRRRAGNTTWVKSPVEIWNPFVRDGRARWGEESVSARLNLSCVEEQRFVIELRLNRFQKVKEQQQMPHPAHNKRLCKTVRREVIKWGHGMRANIETVRR